MILYRWATDIEFDDIYPGYPPDDWVTLRDEYGNVESLLVPVEKCVHGKYDGHEHIDDKNCEHPWWIRDDLGCNGIKQCSGAELEAK